MQAEIERPLLLLGKPQGSLHLLSYPPVGDRWWFARTAGEATVETMAGILKPAAILLEASELYLEGRTILSRLKGDSRQMRILFLDVEGPWALLMEFISEETNDLRVYPCAVDALGSTLMEFLESGSGGSECETGPAAENLPWIPTYTDLLHTV